MSRAAAKRILQLDTRWKFEYFGRAPQVGEKAQRISFRQVCHVQSNAVAFSKFDDPQYIAAAQRQPQSQGSWLYFDQKGERWTVSDDGNVIVIQDITGGPVMRYTRLKPEETV